MKKLKVSLSLIIVFDSVSRGFPHPSVKLLPWPGYRNCLTAFFFIFLFLDRLDLLLSYL